jgi:hypothetical protein
LCTAWRQGTRPGTLTIDGQTRTLAGIAYHDHTWGDPAIPELIHYWY